MNLFYERMFWSAFDELDLNFNDQVVESTLGGARLQDWNDTNDFRLGVSYQHNDALKLVLGVSYEDDAGA